MRSYTAGKLKNLINRNSNTFDIYSKEFKELLIDINNFDKNNLLYTLELKDEQILLKSDALKFYPLYEQKLVTDGEHVFWRGQFFYETETGKRESLATVFIDVHGRVSINNTTDWDYGIQSTEVYAELLSALFESAISKGLITP